MNHLKRSSRIFFDFILCGFFLAGFTAFAQTAPLRYAIIPENPMPGEPVTVGIKGAAASGVKSAVLLGPDGRQLARAVFFDLPDEEQAPLKAAVLAAPSTAQAGFAVINVENVSGIIAEIPLVIRERQFASEEIQLNETLTEIRSAPDPQKTAESELLWGIINRTGNTIYSLDSFSPPVSSPRRTSHFGDRRVFRYSNGATDTSVHAGIDYGIPTGTQVTACAPGKVILARFRIVTGNSVIVEHLPGVYSLYYHLDKITAVEGTLVAKGDQLGLSGATGLATGPHLHWEIRVSGENTDPDVCINRPLLDKEAILAKIGN